MKNPHLVIHMMNKKTILLELFPEIAPNTTASVMWLAGKGLYNNRPFYRVVKDFVIQTGCSKEMDYKTGCDYVIDSECSGSGFSIPQPLFEKYHVGMAGMGPGSNITSGSEFFITTGEPPPRLNNNFPVIGRVMSGFEEVDRINNVACSDTMVKNTKYFQPLEKEIMEKVTVETFGVSYPPPKTRPYPHGYLEAEEEINKARLY